jgi:hypothetical protein
MDIKIECVRIGKNGSTTSEDITNQVDLGLSIVEKLDESLDIGSFTISNDTAVFEFDLFDIVDIYIDEVLTYSFRIGGIKSVVTGKNPLIYQHTISLVEHTKILEREVISGFTLTQPIEDGATKYTLYDTLLRLRNTVPLELSSLYTTTRTFDIDSSLATLLDTVESPEFTFKDITLREAINQIASVLNAVARLDRESTLTFDFYNDLLTLISDETNIIEKSISQDIDYYATDLTRDAINMVNDSQEKDGVEIYPSESLFTTHRTNEFFLTPSNMVIPTNKRIYRVRKLIWRGDITISNNAVLNYFPSLTTINGEYDVDISDRVLEFKEYQTLQQDKEDNLFNITGTVFDERKNPDNKFKSNHIYYNYKEKNIIDNETTGMWDTTLNVDLAIKASVYTQLVDNGTITATPNGWAGLNITINSNELEYLWKVEYETIPNSIRINSSREDNIDIDKKTSLQANQQSRIVNMQNFVRNTEAVINRIGNKELELSHRVLDVSNSYNIGDYTSDLFILTVKETILFDDFAYCKYGLSRNFNRISQFIGVNSEERQWEISEKDRTLERDLLYKEYIYVDAQTIGAIVGSSDSEILETLARESYVDTFNPSSTKPTAKVGVCKPYDKTGARIGSTYYYKGVLGNSVATLLPMTFNGAGRSIVINFEFDSNKNAGNWINNKQGVTGVNATNQYSIDYSPYTDDNGENVRMEIEIYEDLVSSSPLSNKVINGERLPYIGTAPTNKMFDFELYTLKDRRMVDKGTIQLEQKSRDTEKVIIGKALSKKNRLINDNAPNEIRLYTYSNGFKFGRLDTGKVPSGYDTTLSYQITPNTFPTSNFFTITSSRLTSDKDSYCLTDENDNILIAVNQDGTLLNKITFEFLNKDDNVNYKYYNN